MGNFKHMSYYSWVPERKINGDSSQRDGIGLNGLMLSFLL
jgi:hypothetical protein